jgi:hypothetical protein
MPGRHVRRAAPSVRGRRTAPAVASRISAAATTAVFVMAVLIGVIIEHSVAPRLGMGYGAPLGQQAHGRKVPSVAVPRATPSVHPAHHAPAVKHPVVSVASVPGAVQLTMLADRGPAAAAALGGLPGTQPFVDLLRHQGSWAFGTAAIGVPAGDAAMPDTALFLAHASGSRWYVALDGTGAFAQMLLQAPGPLVPATEKQLLAQYNAARQAASSRGTGGQASAPPTPGQSAGATSSPGSAASPAPASTPGPGTQTGLALPWKASESWTMIPSPGQRPDGADPLAQASFTGGDGRVLSAGAGRLYRFCTSGGAGPGDALIEVIHADGSASEYYQMEQETTAGDGSPVRQGEYLGHTGSAVPCGGASGRPDVEFSLLGASSDGLDGVTIGGWTFRETLQPVQVWAQHGGHQVLPGAPLRSLGSLIDPGKL